MFVAGLVDHAHAALAEFLEDLEVGERSTDHDRMVISAPWARVPASARQAGRQDFYRHRALQPRVFGTVHFPNAARAEEHSRNGPRRLP